MISFLVQNIQFLPSACHFLKQETTNQCLWFEGQVESKDTEQREAWRYWMANSKAEVGQSGLLNLLPCSCETLNQESVVLASCSPQLRPPLTEVNHKAKKKCSVPSKIFFKEDVDDFIISSWNTLFQKSLRISYPEKHTGHLTEERVLPFDLPNWFE